MFFLKFFSVLTKDWGWNVLEADRVLRSWHHIGWRNTKICIQGFHKWSDVVNVENHIFLKVNWEFLWVIWIKWKLSVCSIILYSSAFYSLFISFFILEIFKFQCDRFFVRHSASIPKFEWFEQLWGTQGLGHFGESWPIYQYPKIGHLRVKSCLFYKYLGIRAVWGNWTQIPEIIC